MLTSLHLHEKSSEVCIKARSPPASLTFLGQVTKHTTVKWAIIIITNIIGPLQLGSRDQIFPRKFLYYGL